MDTTAIRITVIGGGNMGGAIVRGMAQGKLIQPNQITVSDLNETLLIQLREFEPGLNTTLSNITAIEKADIIILAVKPWFVSTVADEIRKKVNYRKQLIVSIAAGVDFKTLSSLFSDEAVLFRVIPNTAIEVLQSVSVISSHKATEEQERLVERIFGELGKVFIVPESQQGAFTSLSSCGIAYAFRYIRAAMEGGVEMGINPTVSKQVILQTLKGAVELLETSGEHPEAEIDKVTTPGGITIKGLNEMEAHGFSNAVIKGLKASHLK
jgi:pyrroline-5-carboxylate reductase